MVFDHASTRLLQSMSVGSDAPFAKGGRKLREADIEALRSICDSGLTAAIRSFAAFVDLTSH